MTITAHRGLVGALRGDGPVPRPRPGGPLPLQERQGPSVRAYPPYPPTEVVTAPRRDRYIDSLQALALVWVMTYHVFGWAWIPMFPAMGILFALAGSAVAGSLSSSAGNPWRVLKERSVRVLPPVWLFGLVVVPVMLVAGWSHSKAAGVPLSWQTLLFWLVPISDPPASELGSEWVSPLWYIRDYLWFLLLSPATLWLFRHWPKRMLALPVTVVVLSAVGFPLEGRSGELALSLAVFGGCWMLGFAHHDNTIRSLSRGKVLVGGAALMALGLTWAVTHQDPVSTYDIDSIPMADTLYSLGAVLILLRLRPKLSWMQKRVVLDKIVSVASSRAMTLYLWGTVAVFLSTPLLDRWTGSVAVDRENGVGSLLRYLVSWLVLIAVVVLFGWCEDLAARRPLRINPWPRTDRQLDTRRTSTFAHLASLADLTPRQLLNRQDSSPARAISRPPGRHRAERPSRALPFPLRSTRAQRPGPTPAAT